MRGGTYRLDRTVLCHLPGDVAGQGKIYIEAYPNEQPCLTSDIPVTGWHKPVRYPAGLPDSARNHLLEADLPDLPGGRETFYSLYAGDLRLRRARSPGFLPVENPLTDRSTLCFPKHVIRSDAPLHSAELLIRPAHAWIMNILGIKNIQAISETESLLTTDVPGTYPLTKCKHFIDNIRASCWIENVPEYLDQPGTWYLDNATRKIYLWPGQDDSEQTIVIPALTEYIRIEGNTASDAPIEGVILRGLTFTRGDRRKLQASDATVQHEWEVHDQDNALVRLRCACNCVVEDCQIMNSGGTGIRLDLYSQGNIIRNNRLSHLGGTGILLCGYGPGLRDVHHHNQILGNQIRHIGEIYWHSPGIFAWHSNHNTFAGNQISQVNYTGIVVSGSRPGVFRGDDNADHGPRESRVVRRSETGEADKWREILRQADSEDAAAFFRRIVQAMAPYQHAGHNRIVNNEISAVMQTMGDGNGIYLSDTEPGNQVLDNYIHDLDGHGGQQAIRTDEYIVGAEISRNIIHRCNGGGINLKHYGNCACENIIADIRTIVDQKDDGQAERMFFGYCSLVCVDPRPIATPEDVIQIKGNIFYQANIDQTIYRVGNTDGHTATEQVTQSKVRECDVDYNCYYSAGDPHQAKELLRQLQLSGLEKHGVCADPEFIDLAAGQYKIGNSDVAELRLRCRNE
jgi:parallel beta-helix repeat protein